MSCTRLASAMAATLLAGCFTPNEAIPTYWNRQVSQSDGGEGNSSVSIDAASSTATVRADTGTLSPSPPRDAAVVDTFLPVLDALAIADLPIRPADTAMRIDSALGPDAPPGCSLKVTVTTVTTDDDYAPRNIGAIWIADGAGKFVKTLKIWASKRRNHLNTWLGATAAAGLSANMVDAVSGATISSHRTHIVFWNCTDTKREAVSNGNFRVYFEMNESNGRSQNAMIPFTKGPTGFELAFPDTEFFINQQLVLAP